MAVQAHPGFEFPVGLDLVMRVQGLILFFIMTTVTEIRFPGVGRSPQSKPVEPSLDALPVDIVAGVAGKFSILKRKAGRQSRLPLRGRIYIQWMAVAGGQAVMTPVAEPLVVAVVFQIGIPPFDRCAFMALTAVLSRKVDIGLLIDHRRRPCRPCGFGRLLPGHRPAAPNGSKNNQD